MKRELVKFQMVPSTLYNTDKSHVVNLRPKGSSLSVQTQRLLGFSFFRNISLLKKLLEFWRGMTAVFNELTLPFFEIDLKLSQKRES